MTQAFNNPRWEQERKARMGRVGKSKTKTETPVVSGARVELRGRGLRGVVLNVSVMNPGWISVQFDGKDGPMVCHRDELLPQP